MSSNQSSWVKQTSKATPQTHYNTGRITRKHAIDDLPLYGDEFWRKVECQAVEDNRHLGTVLTSPMSDTWCNDYDSRPTWTSPGHHPCTWTTNRPHMQTKSHCKKTAHMMHLFSLLQCHPQDGALDTQQQAERHLILHKQTNNFHSTSFLFWSYSGWAWSRKENVWGQSGNAFCRRPDALPVVQPTVSENWTEL